MEDVAIDKAVAFMRENYMEKISISDLETIAGVSRFSLSRSFRRRFGVPPIGWLWMYRLHMAQTLLHKEPNWSCSAIAYYCGFETPAHFNRRFRVFSGYPPGVYRGTGPTS